MPKLSPLSQYLLEEAEQPPKLTREQFFTYHANAGGKLLTCYISGLVCNINKREFNKLPRGTKLELPCGTLHTITD